tara:strand:- start:591 stop:749 length:159 start_codon:yes stop_codon:yes gene_type:complete
VIADLKTLFVTENLETITAGAASRVQTLIYISSDDNSSGDQCTLLLIFELLP